MVRQRSLDGATRRGAAVCDAAWVVDGNAKAGENPLFKKVLDSQKAYAQRVIPWQNDYMVDFKMAYNHYFGKK